MGHLSLASELAYYIEDHWTASLTGQFIRQRSPAFQGFSADVRSASFAFSIGYNRGALDAPGLIAPVRPLP